MTVLVFRDRRRFKAQLDFLEHAQSEGKYYPWEPAKGCITYVFVDSNTLESIYTNSRSDYDALKTAMTALAEEAQFELSFCEIHRPIQIKRYLRGKPKGQPQSRVVHFDTLKELYKEMIICTNEHYNESIINK